MGELQEQYDLRNYRMNIAEGILYISSAAFISVQIVLPALIARLGGGNIVVGILPVIVYVGLFLPQVFAARTIETLPSKKGWAIKYGFFQRLMILLIAIAVLVLGGSWPRLALLLFLVFFALHHVFAGIGTPAWFDLFTRITPLRKRGRLVGFRTSLGGAAAFLCGLVLTWLLATFDFPLNYAVGFFIAIGLQISSLIVQMNLVEGEPSRATERRPVFAYLRRLPAVFRSNRNFKYFIISSAFLIVGNMPIGFFTVYALRSFSADESMVGQFTLSMLMMQAVSALISGFIVDRYGNKRALMIAALGMLGATLWALVAPSLGWFRLVYVFLGANVGTELMARYNISAEYGPAEQRPTYVALMNTVLAPVYLSALAAGMISDLFGYRTLFFVAAAFSVVGIFLLATRVRDPRVHAVVR
jgi:MFS family permease